MKLKKSELITKLEAMTEEKRKLEGVLSTRNETIAGLRTELKVATDDVATKYSAYKTIKSKVSFLHDENQKLKAKLKSINKTVKVLAFIAAGCTVVLAALIIHAGL